MIPPDQPSAADKEDLDDRILSVLGHGQDIFILPVRLVDLLLLGNLQHALPQIPVRRRVFKVQFLRRFLHLFLQHLQNRGIIAIQEIKGPVHIFPVGLLPDLPLARRIALPDLVIQAGPFLSDIPRENSAAVPDLIKLPQKINGIADCPGALERSEISGFVFFHLPRELNPGIFLLHGDTDIGISLVIFQKGIVLGPVLLDQVVLQDQGFQLGIRYDVFKAGNLLHHALDLRTPPDLSDKILMHSAFEIDRLPHIDDRVLCVMHDVYAGAVGKLLQFLLYVKYGNALRIPLMSGIMRTLRGRNQFFRHFCSPPLLSRPSGGI